MGGKMKEDHGNAVQFRNSQMLAFLYLHYDEVKDFKDVKKPKEMVEELIGEMHSAMIGTKEHNWENGFMRCNNQWVAFPNGLDNVDENVLEFFDSQENYDRIKKIRDAVD